MSDLLALLSFGPEGWGDEILAGAVVTLELAVATLPVGVAIGLGIALLKNGPSRWGRVLGDLYTTIFRGLPELLTLFIVYYGGQILLSRLLRLFFASDGIQVSSFLAGAVALSLVLGAFSSEVFLAALRAMPRQQAEAARALGLSRPLTFRLVLLPQLWRLTLPGLTNNWLVLLKDTSLVSVIALNDLMRETFIAVGNTKQPLLFYTFACLIYLAMSAVSAAVAAWLEQRASRGYFATRS
jgi:polar amino acid transport system permease protein